MSRYIDAKALFESLKSKRLIFEESTPIEEAIAEQVSVFKEAIEEVPTADVVEVRHREWVVKDLNNPFYESKKAPHCSGCDYMSFIKYDYCPNCGAKMDGERREGNDYSDKKR